MEISEEELYNVYSPKIKEGLVRELYIYKHSSVNKIPMTKMVNEAIEQYLERKKYEQKENNETGHKSIGDNNRNP